MCKISETEISDWQRKTELRLQATGRPGTERTSGRHTAIVTVVIPIQWLPVEFWAKPIRAGKSL